MAKHGQGNGHKDNLRDRPHVTETPDVSHIKNVDVTHEASDVSIGGILKFAVGLTIFAVIVHVLIWGMFIFLNAQEEKKEPQPGPMAMTPEERLPPDPRLQAAPGFGVKLENGQWVPLEKKAPQAEYRVLRQQWEQRLKCDDLATPGQVNGQTTCTPIDQAMQQVIGLPSRVKTISEEGPGWRAEDYGVDMPSAASSGRVTEKGKR
jgi:hypothetical protein